MAVTRPNARASNRWPMNVRKWHWTHDEDVRLTQVVYRFGARNWDRIAKFIKGRTGKSCRVRWFNQLNPEINKSPFSEEEKQRLLKLHEKYGNRWSAIASFFPGRTDNQMKNSYHVLARSRSMNASAAPSSSANPCVPLQGGPIRLSGFDSISTVPPGSQFPNVSSPGNHFRGFVPRFSAMADSIQIAPFPVLGSGIMRPFPIADGIKMMPSFQDGSSPNYTMGETLVMAQSANPGWVYPHSVDNAKLNYMTPYYVTSHGGASSAQSMMPTANSAAFSKISPTMLPEQGEGVKGPQFINFLGVQNPE